MNIIKTLESWADWLYGSPEPTEVSTEAAEQKAGAWDYLPGMQFMPGYGDEAQAKSYTGNPYAYRCINLISQSVGRIPWAVKSKSGTVAEDSLQSHPLIQLLRKPNDRCGTRLIETVVTHLLLDGNAYLLQLAPTPKAPPMELHALLPGKVSTSRNSLGVTYTYDDKYTYDQTQVLQLTTMNPGGKDGIATILPAVGPIKFNNASRTWNESLLREGGKISGALIAKDLDDAGYQRMLEVLRADYGGAKNAGKLMALRGDVDFKAFGLNPDDASWLDGQRQSIRDIATVFGIPSVLLGDPEASTLANYEQAQKFFYQSTVRYWIEYLRDALNLWLVPMYPDSKQIYLDYEDDEIPELRDDQTASRNDIRASYAAGLLTLDEARLALGLATIGGDQGSSFQTPTSSNNQPTQPS